MTETMGYVHAIFNDGIISKLSSGLSHPLSWCQIWYQQRLHYLRAQNDECLQNLMNPPNVLELPLENQETPLLCH
jgi:hypothetical protein